MKTFGQYAEFNWSCGQKVELECVQNNINADKTSLCKLGIYDAVVTYDSFKAVLQMAVNNLDKKDEQPYSALHSSLQQIVQDDNIMPEIVRLAFENNYYRLGCLRNSSCPDDIIAKCIKSNKTKDDPAIHTSIGQVIAFIISNKCLKDHFIDEIARMTRNSYIQLDCIEHENVSNKTLEYLSKSGKTKDVKAAAEAKLQLQQKDNNMSHQEETVVDMTAEEFEAVYPGSITKWNTDVLETDADAEIMSVNDEDTYVDESVFFTVDGDPTATINGNYFKWRDGEWVNMDDML